jgi:hypothetical protein
MAVLWRNRTMPSWEIGACCAIATAAAAALWRLRLLDPVVADEGYLWYGSLRLLAGEIPHRDYRSYEPGRYLWCALPMAVLGGRLPVLRAAVHAFYLLGLAAALGSLRASGLDWATLVLSALTLVAWAFPQHKLFEPALTMLAFAAFLAFTTSPAPATAAAAGAIVGIALVFGFNLILYSGAALALLIGLALATGTWSSPRLAWLSLGGSVAALPFLVPFAVSPGFRRAFVDRRITRILRRRAANLPLPMPWPWRPATAQMRWLPPWRRRAVGALFVLLPALPCLWLLGAALARGSEPARPGSAALVAAALGAFTWHHAYSRADLPHLAQSIVPVLLLLQLGAARSPAPALCALLLAVASLSLLDPLQPSTRRRLHPQAFPRRELPAGRITLTREQSGLVDCLASLRAAGAAPDRPVLAVPTLAWLYPMLGLKSPVYDTYGVWPATPREQARMIEELERSGAPIAVVSNGTFDGSEDLRFSRTHPEVFRHLRGHFDAVECATLPADVYLFRRVSPRRP